MTLPQNEIVQIMREALIKIQFSVKGHCPDCGEDKVHYRTCVIKKALEASNRYIPRIK